MTTYRCKCGLVYHALGVRTKDEDICDDCGAEMALAKP